MQDVAAAKDRVLVLDYDGTIAPFSAHRLRAYPYPEVPDLLHRIMTDCRTRLIVASGRAAHELISLLGMLPPPEIWGTHGAERVYADGRYEEIELTQDALEVLLKSETRLEREGLSHLLEVKLAAVAVRRGLKPAEILQVRSKAYKVLEPLAGKSGLVLAEFEEGVEIRLRAANKGTALHSILTDLPAEVPVAYLGDDITDEDAFRVLNDRGLTVLVNAKPRFTAAQVVIKPPNELIAFLNAWIKACEAKS
jgi:trehalose-phosphatase